MSEALWSIPSLRNTRVGDFELDLDQRLLYVQLWIKGQQRTAGPLLRERDAAETSMEQVYGIYEAGDNHDETLWDQVQLLAAACSAVAGLAASAQWYCALEPGGDVDLPHYYQVCARGDGDRRRRDLAVTDAQAHLRSAAGRVVVTISYDASLTAGEPGGVRVPGTWFDTYEKLGWSKLEQVIHNETTPVEPNLDQVAHTDPKLQVAWDWMYTRHPQPVRQGQLSDALRRAHLLGLSWRTSTVARAISERCSTMELQDLGDILR